jgi:hypothetical protein
MINANELRIGNLIIWNPQLMYPHNTLDAVHVEVMAVRPDKIGYTFPNLDHRVEPFEDDLLQTESRYKLLAELEPIKLTGELLQKCHFSDVVENFNKKYLDETSEGYYYSHHQIKIQLPSLHQLQNLYFLFTGEELDISL